MYLKYLLFWFGLLILAMVNGIVREAWYGKHMSELSAHQLSSLSAVAVFFIYTWFLQIKWPIESASQAWGIGVIWLGLTIAFEFLFGHFVMNHPWTRLLHDYNLVQGRLWTLVLLGLFLTPWIVYTIHNLNHS